MSTDSMWSYTVVGPQSISEQEVPAPSGEDLTDGQVLLKVMVGGICGSDLPYFKGMVMPYGIPTATGVMAPPPGSPLHEVVGEVMASRDSSLAIGSIVVGWATRMNGMSEYIVVNGTDLHVFSDALSPSVAIMLQPLACVIYAVDQLQDIPGSRAAVIGQGSIGVLFSHVLKSRGAAHVTGIDRVDRSDTAAVFGVDEPVWSTSDRWGASTATQAQRPDIVVEAVGHQVSTLVDATSALADGGQIFYFGIPDDPVYPFPMMKLLRTCGRLYAGYTPFSVRRDCLRSAEEYVLAQPEIIEPYLTKSYKFAQAQDAFASAIAPRRGQLKITLEV